MRTALAILAALAISGCVVLRHDSIVRGVFPDDSAFDDGIPVAEEWAR